MSSGVAILYLIVTSVADVFVDHAWAQLNAATNYAGWQLPTVLAYQHLIPMGASAALAGIIFAKLSL